MSVFSVVSVAWSVSVGCSVCVLCLFYCVSVCYPFLSMCSLYVCLLCVSCMCGVYLLLVYVSLMCACVTALVCIVSVYLCLSVFYVCVMCLLYSVCVCVPYFLCMCMFSVLVLCLCCWLPCWCGVYHGGVMGACFLGLVVLVFWGVWRVWNFFIFYSRFLVGGRLLLGFCYRTFFCGFPWGLCHTRNFFKDITHSYCGYVAPVMSLYMHLLAHLYHT